MNFGIPIQIRQIIAIRASTISLLAFLVFVQIHSQGIPYEIGILDNNKDPVLTKDLQEVVEVEGGVFMVSQLASNSDIFTLSFFNGDIHTEIYHTTDRLRLLAGTNDGAYLAAETNDQDHLVYVTYDGSRIDTLTDETTSLISTYYWQERLYVFDNREGPRSYSPDGDVTILPDDYAGYATYFYAFEDFLIYENGRHQYVLTDGTSSGTRLIFDETGDLLSYKGLLFNFGFWSTEVFNPQTNTVVEINAKVEGINGEIRVVAFTPTTNGILVLAYSSESGYELFRTNEECDGFVMLKETISGPDSEVRNDLSINSGKEGLIFYAKGTESYTTEIWASDGTESGTEKIYDIPDAGIGNSRGMSFQLLEDGSHLILIFQTSGFDSETELFTFKPQNEVPIAHLHTYNHNLRLNDIYTHKDHIIVGGNNQTDTLSIISLDDGSETILGVLELYSIEPLKVTESSFTFYHRGSGLVDTIYHVNVDSKILKSAVLDFSRQYRGSNQNKAFVINDELFVYSFDKDLGESISKVHKENSSVVLMSDLYLNNGSTGITLIKTLGNKLLVTEGGMEYISDGRTDTFKPLMDHPANPLESTNEVMGSIEDRYYFGSRVLGSLIQEVDLEGCVVNDMYKIISEDRHEIEGFEIVDDQMYATRKITSQPYRRELVTYNSEMDEINTIAVDTVTSTSLLRNFRTGTDGRVLYFTSPQNDGLGPTVYDPTSQSITKLGVADPPFASISYIEVDDRVIVQYTKNGLYTYQFVSPDGLSPSLGVDYINTAIGLKDKAIVIDDSGNLISLDYETYEVSIIDDFEYPSYIRLLTKYDNQSAIYFKKQDSQWWMWITDGTSAGTLPILALPGDIERDPEEVEVLGHYIAMTFHTENLYLYDRINDILEIVDVQLPNVSRPELITTLNDRLYFSAINAIYGNEVHYIELNFENFISGIVFLDDNNNGERDPGESGISNVPIDISGGNITRVYTDDHGEFRLPVIEGVEYNIRPIISDCYELSSISESYHFTYESNSEYSLDFGLGDNNDKLSTRVFLTSGPIRCGFTVPFWLTVVNDGCGPLSGNAGIILGDLVEYRDSEILPSTIADNILEWKYENLAPGEIYHVKLSLKMPGEVYNDQIIPLEVFTNANGTSDKYNYEQRLQCAIDPNDKLVYPSREDLENNNYTQLDEELIYTIRFQNVGTDTAFNVRIEDRIDDNLDVSSIRLLGSSHDYRVQIDKVDILHFYFDNILLPDSTTNEPESHGFVTFSIRAHNNIDPFSIAENTADIFFDFNRPVTTNTLTSTFVEELDADKDGHFFWQDCDDQNPEVFVITEEIPNNGIDEDCNGEDLVEESLSLDTRLSLTAEWSEGQPLLSWINTADSYIEDIVVQRYELTEEKWRTIKRLEIDNWSRGSMLDVEFPTSHRDLYYRVFAIEERVASNVMTLNYDHLDHDGNQYFVVPNPSEDGIFFLSIQSNKSQYGKYTIMNSNGQRLMTDDLVIKEGTNEFSIVLTSVPSSIYYLQVMIGEEMSISKLVIN